VTLRCNVSEELALLFIFTLHIIMMKIIIIIILTREMKYLVVGSPLMLLVLLVLNMGRYVVSSLLMRLLGRLVHNKEHTVMRSHRRPYGLGCRV
jgi:hypothetical protein